VPPAPPAYGAPAAPAGGYGYAPAPRTSSNAVVALVLAIAAWVVCPIVPAVVALPVASSAQREIDSSGGWVTGTGLVQAARIIAWINIGLLGVALVVLVLVLLIAGVSGSR
jgi:hypothetical protein